MATGNDDVMTARRVITQGDKRTKYLAEPMHQGSHMTHASKSDLPKLMNQGANDKHAHALSEPMRKLMGQ